MIQLKRVYDESEPKDGFRVLVDRLWPRGISKERANLHLWLKEIAPSPQLRTWFAHDPAKWNQFRDRYREELAQHDAELQQLTELAKDRNLTLLFAARDKEHNEAVVIRDLLTETRNR